MAKNAVNAIKQDMTTMTNLSSFSRLRQIQKETADYRRCVLSVGLCEKVEEKDKLKQKLTKMYKNIHNDNSEISFTDLPMTTKKDRYMLLLLMAMFGGFYGLSAAHKTKKDRMASWYHKEKGCLSEDDIFSIRENFVCGTAFGSAVAIPFWLSWCHPLRIGILAGGYLTYKFLPSIV